VPDLTPWHWFVLAALLVGAEMMVPGAFLVWIGATAAVVGLVALAVPNLGPMPELALFAVLGIASIAGALALRRRRRTSPTDLNDPIGRLIGTTTVLETAIVNGRGRALVADGAWSVTGPDLPEGTPVRIVAATPEGLTVEPIPPAVPSAD